MAACGEAELLGGNVRLEAIDLPRVSGGSWVKALTEDTFGVER